MFAAGLDLYSVENYLIRQGGCAVVDTGIQIQMPKGTYGRIAGKSILSTTVAVGAGVIDWDYRGNVKVLLFNLLLREITIKKGDSIAQLVVEKIATPNVIKVHQLPSVTARGESGGINEL